MRWLPSHKVWQGFVGESKRKEPGHYAGLYQQHLFFGWVTTPNAFRLTDSRFSSCHQCWGHAGEILDLTGLQAIGAVVAGIVHELGNAVTGHVLGWVRAQQGFQELRLEAVGLQPPLVMFRANNHWHPVVGGGDHWVGFCEA